MELKNADGGIVTVPDDLAEAFLSAGFVPVEREAPAEPVAVPKPTKKTATKKAR